MVAQGRRFPPMRVTLAFAGCAGSMVRLAIDAASGRAGGTGIHPLGGGVHTAKQPYHRVSAVLQGVEDCRPCQGDMAHPAVIPSIFANSRDRDRFRSVASRDPHSSCFLPIKHSGQSGEIARAGALQQVISPAPQAGHSSRDKLPADTPSSCPLWHVYRNTGK